MRVWSGRSVTMVRPPAGPRRIVVSCVWMVRTWPVESKLASSPPFVVNLVGLPALLNSARSPLGRVTVRAASARFSAEGLCGAFAADILASPPFASGAFASGAFAFADIRAGALASGEVFSGVLVSTVFALRFVEVAVPRAPPSRPAPLPPPSSRPPDFVALRPPPVVVP